MIRRQGSSTLLSKEPRRAVSSSRRRAHDPTRLVADAMLGSLARKLRAFGFDTIYYKDGEDSTLLELAASEGRVLLTSDRALSERADNRRIMSLVIMGSKESKRLVSLRFAADAKGLVLVRGPPRCSLCNGNLERSPRSELANRLPAGVLSRHRLFYRCVLCGMVYWRGSHWKKLRWLEKRLEQDS
ncbi:MAG TPA: Mut7-C RNAse domain-containing protein [Nitrososphaerales archaeon]|nr:Mut7-C RNAse domain-containing protein [Nitrososphaerales archaeon]